MAETKNSFLRGKMNKDLDDRLLPNGEYRDALNISVGKSEDKSVGSLQNVLGNSLLTMPGSNGTVPFETNNNLVCIGYFVDNENSRIFQFLTDYTDPTPSLINLPSVGSEMKITVYNASSNAAPYTVLVEGEFLNFSTTNLITGVNLIENLLFWTDNRNQPRKINVGTALNHPATSATPYYTNTEQISVAKYAPFKSPTLYEEVNVTTIDAISTEFLGQTIIEVSEVNNLALGDQLVNEDLGIFAGDAAVVIKKGIPVLGVQEVYIAGNWTIAAESDLTFYRTTMTNSSDNSNVNGNDNFLIDKFVRFSYRFKFDDNEYSLMAPFTQPIFIPLQKGYFINGDEEAAYASTVLEWMQNRVNGVRLHIELPDTGNNIVASYKIDSIDILYKESDSLAVKVVETIPISVVQQASTTTNLYTYTYNSQKPKKTLQEAETIRVYDKVPIRALAQESSGNRIMYGNFVNQSTPPQNLNYNIQVLEKNAPRTSWYEYPNHTLKQNRTYQVGVILADKFGRQSSVILSNATPFAPIEDIIFGSSSVFFPYKSDNWDIDVKNWLGDVLSITFNSTITSVRDEAIGTPGLYATVSGNSIDGFEITESTQSETTVDGITTYTYDYTLQSIGTPQTNYPTEGTYLKGKYKDYVKVLTASSGTLTTDSPIDDLYIYNPINIPDIKYSYSINELGWYSYKIVVKQTEQEYYNVYVPGMLSGYPIYQTFATTPTVEYTSFPPNEETSTAHFVLINDNINKVPRDLSEVGPNQRQYRSSVQLWGRVENVLLDPMTGDPLESVTTNRQYYPGTTPDIVNTVAPTTELNFLATSLQVNPLGSAEFNLYQFNTSPLIARASTVKQIGVVGNYDQTPTSPSAPASDRSMSPFLGVYETNPVESLLDIFWETSTSDYISNLNWDINVGSNGVVGFSPINFIYNENQPLLADDWILDTGAVDSSWVTDVFWFTNISGVRVSDIDSVLFSATNLDLANTDVSSHFELVEGPLTGDGYFRIKIKENSIYFGTSVDTIGSFKFRFLVTNTVGLDVYSVDLNAVSDSFKISNVNPVVVRPSVDNITYFIPINQPGGEGTVLIDSIGKNGCSSNAIASNAAELYWDLESTSPINNPSFEINSTSGDIYLQNDTPTEGETTWKMTLKDSTTTDGFSSPVPNILNPERGSLSTERIVKFDVASRFVWCGYWNANWEATSFPSSGRRLRADGYLDIWKMLKQGETITASTVRLTEYKQDDQVTWQTATTPLNCSIGSSQVGRLGFATGVAPIAFKPTGQSVGWVRYLKFTGAITLTDDDGATRVVNVTFISEGVINGSALPYGSINQQCVIGEYTPEECVDWKIENPSTVNVYWLGLRNDKQAIIGGVIPAGYSIATAGYPITPGVFPYKVRYGTLNSTGQGGVLSNIDYNGTTGSC
jgi:hypothetical protein